RSHFPERNRAIAWIAWATVVVEAARDSGSLITARLAADEGRAVYAVPGPVGARDAGSTNARLRAGALVCRGARDVIEDLAPQIAEAAGRIAALRGRAGSPERAFASPPGPPATPEEKRVLDLIPRTRGIGIEALLDASGM